jgi:hypothetical protein
MLNCRKYSQHWSGVVAAIISSADDALTVLPDDLEAAIPAMSKSR